MDWGLLVGVSGALGGVILGGLLADRSQRELLRAGQRESYRQSRESAFVDFLAAFRSFRRVLISDPKTLVTLSQTVPGSKFEGAPVVHEANVYWDAVERANARIQVLAGGTEIDSAAWALMKKLFDLARTRVDHEAGEIPRDVIEDMRAAEEAFIKAAQVDLGRFGGVRQIGGSSS